MFRFLSSLLSQSLPFGKYFHDLTLVLIVFSQNENPAKALKYKEKLRVVSAAMKVERVCGRRSDYNSPVHRHGGKIR